MSEDDERAKRRQEYEKHWHRIFEMQGFDRGKLEKMSDTELAAWQAMYEPTTAQHRLAEHIWHERLAQQQIAASRRATYIAAASGLISGLIGVFVGWLLSSWHPFH
jgi:hypothetical protein